MKVFRSKKPHRSSFFYSGFVLIAAFILALGIVGFFIKSDADRNKERADQLASLQAGKLQHVIDNLLFITNTVDAFLKEGNGTIEHFDWIMMNIMKDYPIKNIALAPNGIIAQIYPYEGNEAAMGHNLLTDPQRSAEAKLAKDTGKLTISGPFELRQGGVGAIGRLPVYLENKENHKYFWGFICVTLEFPEALKSAQLDSLEQQGYAYELWRVKPDSGERQVFMRSVKQLEASPREASVTVPNSVWMLSLAPVNGWIDFSRLVFGIILALVFSLLAALLYKNVLELAWNRNELDGSIRQQADNYRRLNQLNEELHRFKHDSKNHLLSLSHLLAHKDIEKAQEYLASISVALNGAGSIINTENYVFDALISQKTEEARRKGIQVESEIIIDKQLGITNTDWSILFGNALDNAIEACVKVKGESRIHLMVRHNGNMLQVRIANTAAQRPEEGGRYFKTTKIKEDGHGFGLSNVEAAVKRYHGVLETGFEEGMFTLSFLLFDV